MLRDEIVLGLENGGRFRICFHPSTRREDRTDRTQEFADACDLVILARNTVLMVDEVWRYCRDGKWMPPPLEDIAFTGRHSGTTLVYTAQRPAKVAKDLLAVSTSHRLFRMTLGGDLRAMADHANVPEEVLEQVRVLPDRQHYWRDEKMQWNLQR
jgi:hypothetical protein